MTTPHNPPAWAIEAAKNIRLGNYYSKIGYYSTGQVVADIDTAAIIAKHAPRPDAPTSGPDSPTLAYQYPDETRRERIYREALEAIAGNECDANRARADGIAISALERADKATSGPEARPIGSLNAEEAEAMVDKFNAAPVTAKTGNFVCINEEDGGCSNKKCAEVGYCIDSYNALCGLKLKQVRDAALSLAGLPQAPSATPQPGPTPETDACTKKAGSESVMEDAHAYRKLCASLEHERDEARRLFDATSIDLQNALIDRATYLRELNEARRERDAWQCSCHDIQREINSPEDIDGWLIGVDELINCFPEEYRKAGYAQSPLEWVGKIIDERDEAKTDRDGLAALCEERKIAIRALMDRISWYRSDEGAESKDDFEPLKLAKAALLATPAEALRRKTQKETQP